VSKKKKDGKPVRKTEVERFGEGNLRGHYISERLDVCAEWRERVRVTNTTAWM